MMQTQLSVGDTTPAAIPTHKIGAIVTLVQCAHRIDTPGEPATLARFAQQTDE